jgi:hypothetical protein
LRHATLDFARLLPHIDTYPEYKPHITLAYLKADSDWQTYVEPLSERLRGASVGAKGLTMGTRPSYTRLARLGLQRFLLCFQPQSGRLVEFEHCVGQLL